MVETFGKRLHECGITTRSTRAADRAEFEVKGFWPPPGYLGRSAARKLRIVDPAQRRIDLADLRRIHGLTAQLFPHEFLDEGLCAIGLFLHNPPKNAGYRSTPTNSITFGSIGIDGIHFGSITDGNLIDPMSPVVITIPMAFDSPNYVVGQTLYEFLCLGCRHGYSNLGNLHLNFEATIDFYQNQPEDFYDERCPHILKTMTDELSLASWPDVRGHFLDLQSRLMPMLRVPANS